MLTLVRQVPEDGLNTYHVSDMTDFDIDVVPGMVWDELNNFNSDYYDGKLKIENNAAKKCMLISQEDQET